MRNLIILFTTVLLSITVNAQHSTYYIGHSGFGWDLIVGAMVDDLAEDAGITTHDYGYQFIGGTCINNQWSSHDEPQGGTDSHVELAKGTYDYLVIAEQIPIEEVVNGSPWCGDVQRTSYEALDLYYDLAKGANSDIKIYLMEFHNEVDQTGATPYESWVQMNADMRPLWEQVADSVSEMNGVESDICIVPVAEAFERMVDSVRAGVFPGITNWIDLFDPSDTAVATIHPTEVTYYLAACVHFATIFGQSPEGLTNETFAAAGWQFDPPTTDQAAMMQKIAWDVVSSDAYACINQETGVDELEVANSSLFPNPAANNVYLRSDVTGIVSVFDLLGNQVLIQSIQMGQNTINIEALNNGLYFFNIQTENGTKTMNLVKH